MSRRQARSYDAALEELREIADKAEELLAEVGGDRDDLVKGVRTRVASSMRSARKRLGGIDTSARAAGTHALDAADEYVTENPWRTVAVVAALGLVAGAVLSRR